MQSDEFRHLIGMTNWRSFVDGLCFMNQLVLKADATSSI
jgi:hypothetical protein